MPRRFANRPRYRPTHSYVHFSPRTGREYAQAHWTYRKLTPQIEKYQPAYHLRATSDALIRRSFLRFTLR